MNGKTNQLTDFILFWGLFLVFGSRIQLDSAISYFLEKIENYILWTLLLHEKYRSEMNIQILNPYY